MELTTAEIAEATGGEVFGRPTTVDGATIDSRTVRPGQLFVPVVAERDGHDFIGAALGSGAAAYLTAGPIEAGTAVRVDDTSAALTSLGGYARSLLGDRVVGVTGSVGKTSVKDLLAAVGATTWRTAASVGSFNNELGVPLTLINAPRDTELTVVEMGARGQGHIAALCAVARPTIGLVTVVAGAHLEQFGTIEEVARAKGELIAHLSATGTAVLNHDDPLVAAMASLTRALVVSFGRTGGDVRAENVHLDSSLRPRFVLRSPWGDADVQLGVAGEHQVTNALGAAAVALSQGAEVAAVAAGLESARLSAMRMDVVTAPNGLRIIDDAYNANPTSMAAALRSLAALRASRRVAVMGAMAELGADAVAAHRTTAQLAVSLGLDVVAVAAPSYGDGSTISHVESPAAAVARLQELGLAEGDAVLVKASRSAQLERVVAALVADRT